MPVSSQDVKPAATDTASIQNKIAEPLRRALEPLLAPPASPFDEQIRSLQQLLDQHQDWPKASVKATEDSLRSLSEARDQANAEHLEAVRSNIAAAIVGAVRTVDKRIPLAVQRPAEATAASTTTPAPANTARSTRKTRMTRAQVNELADKVLNVLPSASSGQWLSRAEIVKRSGVDNESLQSVLIKLKRENQAESNGQRGSAGGWRKAE